MKPRLAGMLLVAVLLAASGMAAAADTPAETPPAAQRLCTAKDLAGAFVLMIFHETPEGVETEFHQKFPHQYIAFYPENVYATVFINLQVNSAQDLDKYLMRMRSQGIKRKYVLSGDGVLDLYIDRKIDYHYRCVASLLNNGGYQKGDLILTGYSKDGQHEFYNLYRHWY